MIFAAILDFGGHLWFNLCMNYACFKLNIILYYLVNVHTFILLYTTAIVFLIKLWIMAAILDFVGRIGFKRVASHVFMKRFMFINNCAKFQSCKRKCTILCTDFLHLFLKSTKIPKKNYFYPKNHILRK